MKFAKIWLLISSLSTTMIGCSTDHRSQDENLKTFVIELEESELVISHSAFEIVSINGKYMIAQVNNQYLVQYDLHTGDEKVLWNAIDQDVEYIISSIIEPKFPNKGLNTNIADHINMASTRLSRTQKMSSGYSSIFSILMQSRYSGEAGAGNLIEYIPIFLKFNEKFELISQFYLHIENLNEAYQPIFERYSHQSDSVLLVPMLFVNSEFPEPQALYSIYYLSDTAITFCNYGLPTYKSEHYSKSTFGPVLNYITDKSGAYSDGRFIYTRDFMDPLDLIGTNESLISDFMRMDSLSFVALQPKRLDEGFSNIYKYKLSPDSILERELIWQSEEEIIDSYFDSLFFYYVKLNKLEKYEMHKVELS